MSVLLTDKTIAKNFLSNAVSFWKGRIEAARTAKEPFNKIADTCYSFYRKSTGFMWEPEFKKKHLDRVERPKFSVTIQKAFELVALFGPYLFWKYPHRKVTPRKTMQFPPELFMDPANPMWEVEYGMLSQQQQQEDLFAKYRALLMETYLNYSQREQPGGLARDVQFAIHDALIKGRGCLWVETYSFPGDSRVLTGSFYDSVDNLFIDPDCKDPGLKTAKYIVRKHVSTYWDLERRFKLPKDSLKNSGTASSHEANVANIHRRKNQTRGKQGTANDLIVWYEVFSKMGIGTRDSAFESEFLHEEFEEEIGDFVYLCIAENVAHPLNLPHDVLLEDVDEVLDAVSWPCPCYADHRWPVGLLDFYPDPDGCWPIAPLGPALGELICMNIILSAFLENAYENRKQIIAVMEHAKEAVTSAIKGTESPAIVSIREDIHKSISDCVTFMNRPEMNNDPLKAMDYLSQSFDKRTGLSEFMYAMSSTQSRSATDIRSKEEKASIRPEKMSNDVADWISEVSQIEKFMAALYVRGEDIETLVGPMGAMLWDRLISSEPVDVVAREMTASVFASDIRKPNKARDSENISTAATWMLPVYQQYATITGDSGPINGFLRSLGDAIEMPIEEWEMGEWVPKPPDPQAMQQQQELMGMEMALKEADVQKKQAEAAKVSSEAQGGAAMKQLELQFEQAKSQLELQGSAAKHSQEIQMTEEQFQQQQAQEWYEFQQKMRQMRVEGNERANQARLQTAIRQNQKRQEA